MYLIFHLQSPYLSIISLSLIDEGGQSRVCIKVCSYELHCNNVLNQGDGPSRVCIQTGKHVFLT